LRIVALLGRADTPTDGVEDYCRLLAVALEKQGISLELRRLAWDEEGWRAAMRRLRREARSWGKTSVLVQYTALAWSRRGFPLGFLAVIWTLKRTGAKISVVFHDPSPFPGARLRDRLRRWVQVRVMRRVAQWSDAAVSAIPADKMTWIHSAELRQKVLTVPIGSNVEESLIERTAPASGPPTVAVFGVTEGNIEEAACIARITKETSRRVGPLRLVVLGRGALQAEPSLRAQLKDATVALEVHGLLSATRVAELLRSAHAQLFVRSGLSARRGSMVAGICSGLPIVGWADFDTAFPVTEAGICMARLGDESGLVKQLAAVLSDEPLRSRLAEKSRYAARRYFSWDVIARELREALQDVAVAPPVEKVHART
jgi:glycosyltransferase involved in cell wall biosynthesis